MPYHLVESVVNRLLAKFEVADIFAVYLSDALVSSLVKGLANLAGINVATCSLRNKCFPGENHIVLQIVNEAHGILAHKNYLKSVWHENEIAVSFLTAVLYLQLSSTTHWFDQEEIDEDPRPDCDKSAGTALRGVTLKVKRGIQATLSKLFFFRSKASQRVGPCP